MVLTGKTVKGSVKIVVRMRSVIRKQVTVCVKVDSLEKIAKKSAQKDLTEVPANSSVHVSILVFAVILMANVNARTGG